MTESEEMTQYIVWVRYETGITEASESWLVDAGTPMLAREEAERLMALRRDGDLRFLDRYFAHKVREKETFKLVG